jgi:acyl-CoA hydrolase
MSDTAPKPPSASSAEMTQLVMPGDANVIGTAFGGRVVGWIDLAAALAAMRHARMPVVTASIDRLDFLAPVRIGQVAIVRATPNAVFGSSMEIGVEVLTEDPVRGDRRKCCDAFLTFVALGPDGRPAPAPRLVLEGPAEKRRAAEAEERRALRQEQRRARR